MPTILDKIVDFFLPPKVVSFLGTTLVDMPYFILNYWSFVHLFSGAIFGFFFPKKFKLWVIINIVFEITEYILGLGGHPLFVEETADIMWDIGWSLLGFWIIVYALPKVKLYILKKKKNLL